MEGKTIGNYRILDKIGEGGMGSVYLAHDLTLERDVAIKIISPDLARIPHLMARFRVEAIAQARLNHTNIVTIHAFDHQEETYYIVMEYVPGKTLKTIIKEKGKIPVQQALKIAARVLDGLCYAHSQGVLHRDIKPANIFITNHDHVKIGDFGIAKVKGIDGLTRVGSTLGTPHYSSPEQIRGQKMDSATDIYSLGITLYEMVTGTLPFTSPSGSNYEIQMAHLEKIPLSPSSLERTIPASVDTLIMKSLAKSPPQRYSGAGEFKHAIEQLLDDTGDKKKASGKIKTGKAGVLPGLKIPKIKLPKIKPIGIDSSFLKKINIKIPGIKGFLQSFPASIKKSLSLSSSPTRRSHAPGSRDFDKRKLLIILIPLLILLFMIIAFADSSPVKKPVNSIHWSLVSLRKSTCNHTSMHPGNIIFPYYRQFVEVSKYIYIIAITAKKGGITWSLKNWHFFCY
jgi:serine/threonine protein kinase